MSTHPKRLTDSEVRKIPAPARSYAITWCPSTPGFGLRVTHMGARAWVIERRIDGQTTRRTLGAASGRGAISAEAARALQLDVSSELQRGVDRLEQKRERIAAAKVSGLTFADALKAYVKNKRRAKDGLPLKERTKADYLSMLDGPRERKGKVRKDGQDPLTKRGGQPTQSGELHGIADLPLAHITASTIQKLHAALEPRGERRQTYAMQVLRAVLRHHGVTLADNPLSPTTAGKDRVHLAPSRGNPSPIPPERIGAWWRAACDIDTVSGDALRFMLLTGCRPGEVASLKVADIDLAGGRATLRDTKNRSDHVVMLSTQALDIVKTHAEGKRGGACLFGVADTGKTLESINVQAQTPGVTPHKLRHTFASVAEELVSAGALKRMLNHASGGDVTFGHYVGKGEAQMRTAWQAVADAIESATAPPDS